MSDKEHPDQAITSVPDCLSLYSAHGVGSPCDSGYTPFPLSYASWEFSDPSSQPDQPTLDPASNESGFSNRAAETNDQEIRSRLLAWLQNEESNKSCQNLSHQMPRSLHQATPGMIFQNLNPLEYGIFSESAATVDNNALDTSQPPSSVPESGGASVTDRRSERRSEGKNKGNPSAAHCNLNSLARYRVLDHITKWPGTEAETVASSLEELKTKAGRAEVSGKTLWYYQKWAAKQADIKDEEIKLCSWCFKAYGVLLPAREMDGVLNACRCEKVTYERRLENNQRDSKERLDIGYKLRYPLHLPVDLA
jgi:hypothetical protein